MLVLHFIYKCLPTYPHNIDVRHSGIRAQGLKVDWNAPTKGCAWCSHYIHAAVIVSKGHSVWEILPFRKKKKKLL